MRRRRSRRYRWLPAALTAGGLALILLGGVAASPGRAPDEASTAEVGLLYAADAVGVTIISLLAGRFRQCWSFGAVALGALMIDGFCRLVFAGMTNLEIAETLGGIPRRHSPFQHFFLDRLGPWTRFLIGHQRHRRHATGMMTSLAAAREDAGDFLVEGYFCRDGIVRGE